MELFNPTNPDPPKPVKETEGTRPEKNVTVVLNHE